jgi:hypothetical protein
MSAIHDWLNDMNLGAAFLAGDVEDVWTVELGDGKSKAADAEDFLSFHDQSGLAFYIGSTVAWFHRLMIRDSGGSPRQPHHIDTSTYGTLDQAITTVIASMLPVLPILVFYFVKDLLVRIGLIFVFTAVFSAVLVVGLQIKPHATLAITTAYDDTVTSLSLSLRKECSLIFDLDLRLYKSCTSALLQATRNLHSWMKSGNIIFQNQMHCHEVTKNGGKKSTLCWSIWI